MHKQKPFSFWGSAFFLENKGCKQTFLLVFLARDTQKEGWDCQGCLRHMVTHLRAGEGSLPFLLPREGGGGWGATTRLSGRPTLTMCFVSKLVSPSEPLPLPCLHPSCRHPKWRPLVSCLSQEYGTSHGSWIALGKCL